MQRQRIFFVVWIEDENRAKKQNRLGGGHTYFTDVTIEYLREIAQNNLFKDLDLGEIAPAYNCACTT